VCCHWPVDGKNGQEIVYPDGEIELDKNDIKSVMEKYENVFYISGHIHGGIKSTAAADICEFANVELDIFDAKTIIFSTEFNEFGLQSIV
jgi:hypothetical protein